MARRILLPRRTIRAVAAALILGGGLGPVLAQQDFGAGPTAPGGPQPQRPAPQRQAPPQGGDFGDGRRGGPPPQAAPAPGPRGGGGGFAGQPQPRGYDGPRGGFDRRDYDRPRGPRGYGPPVYGAPSYGYGYDYGPRTVDLGRICVTSRGECRVRPQPVGSRCGCDTPFGFRPGRVED